MSAPDIKVLLSADGVEQVLAAMRKVQTEVRKTGDDAKKAGGGFASLKQITKEFSSGILPQLGAAAAGAALVGLGKKALDTADSMGKLSQKTGVTTETISVFGFAARTADVEASTLNTSLIKFARTMDEVDAGSKEAAGAVKDLFGSADALKGLTMDERLKKVTDAIGQLEPGSRKTALAVKFFGKAGAEMIPLLDDMAGQFDEVRDRAEAFGLLVNSDLAAAAQNANDRMTDMASAAEGAAVQFMTGLMPALADIAEGMVNATSQSDGLGEGLQWIGKGIGFVAKVGATAFIVVGNSIGTAARFAWDLVASIYAASSALMSLKNPFKAFGQRFGEGVDNYRANTDAMAAQLAKVWSGPDMEPPDRRARTRGEDLGRSSAGSAKKEKAPRTFDESAFNLAASQAAASLDRELLKQQQQIIEETYKAGKMSVDEYYNSRIQGARQAATIEAAADAVSLQILEKKLQGAKDEYEQSQLQLQINEKKAEQDLRALQLTGEINALERERTRVLQEQMTAANGLAPAVEQAKKNADELRQALEGGATNVLNNFFTSTIQNAKSAGEAFRAFGMSVINTLQQIFVQMLVTKMVGALFGIGAGPGGVMNNSAIPMAAEGGIVYGGTPGKDSVPVMTMPGEGILTTRAMGQIGAEAFHDLNQGRAFVVRGRSMPRFADGGIVGGAGADAVQSASIDGAVTVGLEDGLIMRALESPAAGRLMVKHLSKQPKAANQALGRTR